MSTWRGTDLTQEIPLKKKYRPENKIWGYPRTHNGNSNKKKKKIGGHVGATHRYNPRDHALHLQPNMKLRMLHYEDAHRILGEEKK